MKADTVVPLLMHFHTFWIDPLCHLCARGWVDPDEASEVTKSEKRHLMKYIVCRDSRTHQVVETSLTFFQTCKTAKKQKFAFITEVPSMQAETESGFSVQYNGNTGS